VLEGYRVADLTDERGAFAGFLLAQFGADVVSIEPPAGHRHRRTGPFARDHGDDGEGSLVHWATARGKRSVVASSGAELEALAAAADVVVDCGAFDGVEGIDGSPDLDGLRAADPALVTVSLTPFGPGGPTAGWAATDLTLAAAAGQVSVTGDRDRPPVRISVPQVWANAAAEAACGALIALLERERSGLGQHVDVSAQEAMLLACQGWMSPALVGAPTVRRLAGGAELLAGAHFRFVYACRDGHVTTTLLPGVMVGPYTNRLLAWLAEHGWCDRELAGYDWRTLIGDHPRAEALAIVEATIAAVARAFAAHTKEELFAVARERQLLLVPIATTADVLANPHYAERGFWDEVEIAAGRRHRFCGPYARTVGAPMHRLSRPPRLGEHDAEVRRAWAAPRRRTPVGTVAPGARALDDVKVVDLTWVYAGPFATRMLSHHGATVVRVESTARPDQVRSASIPRCGDGGPEDSLQWHSINADKLSLQLNLGLAAARPVVADLARWADVLIEGFAPGVAERLGLDHEALASLNPRLVTVSTSLFGHSGPLSPIPGFGNMGAAMAGFYEVTGWPDRLPAGPYLAYTDATSPKLTAALIAAALLWRDRTGRGAHLDFSQAEGGLHFLGPALLECEVNGVVAGRWGNADRHMAPHGVYPGRGEDRWLAVACADDRQWAALASLLGRPDLAGLPAAERLARREQLDALLCAWSAARDPAEARAELQAAGVAAHEVQNSPEVVADPQLAHRGHFCTVPHPVHGTTWAEQYGFRLSRSPGGPRRAGPTWGEHNDVVLRDLLGYDDERIAELAIAGALE
jgi:crotonobetainyl-CoA:carnitine CoA-transferase CaiB-like acyl-CoA transferase